MKYGAINIDPETMGGTPVFTGTRVPIQTLFDYLEGGDTLEEFLDDFPSVTKDQALEVLELAKKKALSSDLFDKNCNNFTGYRTSISSGNFSLEFCCISSCSSIQDYSLNNNMTVVSGTGDYDFSPLMNNPNFSSNTIRIKNSAINKCVDISISPLGIIELDETLISC
jgi:uncharacterized protein (DUF433 family)